MTTSTPTIITIKLLASTAPNVKDVQAALTEFGTTLQYEAVNLVFNGTGLVPAPSPVPVKQDAPVQAAAPAKKGGRKPGAAPIKVKAKATGDEETLPKVIHAESPDGKVINFEEGSDPHKIWEFIRNNVAMTSTQIREKLGLGSNIVNTTIYRLKKAGMIRPMSYTAPNGDTLYTSTEFDPKSVAEPVAEEPKVNGRIVRLVEDEDELMDEEAF